MDGHEKITPTPMTMEGVTILGVIVLIRTFLSMALQIELEGRLPWQRVRPSDGPHAAKD